MAQPGSGESSMQVRTVCQISIPRAVPNRATLVDVRCHVMFRSKCTDPHHLPVSDGQQGSQGGYSQY